MTAYFCMKYQKSSELSYAIETLQVLKVVKVKAITKCQSHKSSHTENQKSQKYDRSKLSLLFRWWQLHVQLAIVVIDMNRLLKLYQLHCVRQAYTFNTAIYLCLFLRFCRSNPIGIVHDFVVIIPMNLLRGRGCYLRHRVPWCLSVCLMATGLLKLNHQFATINFEAYFEGLVLRCINPHEHNSKKKKSKNLLTDVDCGSTRLTRVHSPLFK